MKRVLLNLLFLFIFSSCTYNDDFHEIIQLRYGTSFGMCVGYCKNEMALKSGLITYKKEGWNESFQSAVCSETLTNGTWNSIVEFNHLDAFFELPEVIGCPDCADGGAEWLEIELVNGEKHEVYFEYLREPDLLKKLLPKLRSEMHKTENCQGFKMK